MKITARALLGFLMCIYCLIVNPLIVSAQDHIPRDIRRKYSEDLYLIRSGNGDSTAKASEAARFEIVKYFEAEISGVSQVEQSATIQIAKGKSSEERMTKILNTIVVSASREIPGIEIVSVKEDKKSYEAWAVLEKSKYSAILMDRMRSIDSTVDHRLANLPSDDLNLVRIYSQIMNDLMLREQTRQDLSILNYGSMPVSNEIVLQIVMTSLDSLIADAFDVGLVFSSDVDGKVRSGVIKGITDAGIRIKEFADFDAAVGVGNDMVIDVGNEVSTQSRTTKIGKKEFTFHFANWVLSVKAMDPATKEIIDSFIQRGETNGSYEDQAKQRMVDKILKTNVPAISNWVYAAIFKPKE